MREILSKRQKSNAKAKVAATRTSSKSVSKFGSKEKKELKKKSASSGRPTATISKQRKISSPKVAGKVAKTARVKKAVKTTPKTSTKKLTPRAVVKPARSQKKVIAKKQVKAKSPERATAIKKAKAAVNSKAKPSLSSKGRRPIRTSAISSRAKGKVKLPLIVSQPAPTPESPRRQVTSGALRAFEQGVKIFNRRQFGDARSMFENVLVKYPGDVEIVARAQMYIQVCKQKVEHETKAAAPRNADELYDRGVFALNIGDFTQARAFFEKALGLHPDEPHLLYSLAATHAQTGSHEEALNYLKRSIQIQPRFRSQAYNDADFSGLRDNKQFLELVGLTSPFDLLESKR
jgi:tetratricopeptide (TPR) repeat protein